MDTKRVLQSKAFVGWINAHLKLDSTVTDLVMDAADGIFLTHLVGHITKQKLRGVTKPRSQADKISNIGMAIDLLEVADLDIKNIPSVEDILNLDGEKVVDFTWELISRTLAPVDEVLRDLKAILPPDAPVITEDNMCSVWADGRLLAQMVNNKKKSGLINVDAGGENLLGDALYLISEHFGWKSW